MRLAFVARAIFHSSLKAFIRGTAAIALFGAIIIAGSGVARAATVKCPATGILGRGTGVDDLLIDRECHVGDGLYQYANVNIIKPGKLIFDEKIPDAKIHFWANSILVENEGSLIAGSKSGDAGGPFGSKGGVLAIHLYGPYLGVGGTGITCKSPLSTKGTPCGIPDDPWLNGKTKQIKFFPNYPKPDFFYQYTPLPFDDGDLNGFFGYKVLAVSYGGTLNLFGNKGAAYASLGAQDSGQSWVRLAGTISPADKPPTLTLSKSVNWQIGDRIVVTTTDYLPDHSEELEICNISGTMVTYGAVYDTATPCPTKAGGKVVQWTHNGEQFSLTRIPSNLNIPEKAAETRAAVGLLTRSIRIVSEGKALGQPLPTPPCTATKPPQPGEEDPCRDYHFGGHTIARQGFKEFKVQGVEFRQMGQGGRLGHYPLHFHMARETPTDTFVKDSSINESMTRWITVHGTQGVTLERNVGYLSIGHGFYLEDAVETDNEFHSNLGIFARAAVMNSDGTANAQNLRKVPGILASPNEPREVPPETAEKQLKFASDKANPTVFWMTNGWNDFEGNMAAGAGFCGVCFWQVPAGIGGPSLGESWESYASEQRCQDANCGTAGTTPIKRFTNNYCTTAMMSYTDVGHGQDCPGTHSRNDQPIPLAPPVVNVNAPRSDAQTPECGPGGTNKLWPLCPNDYYPNVFDGQVNQGTKCLPNGTCTPQNTIFCDNANGETLDQRANCVATVINDYTTSFNWAEFNVSAIWLRKRWHLVSNSFISDVQNAGLTFISGGDYTHVNAIKGLWELAYKTVFVGQTQKNESQAPFASSLLSWLKCDNVGFTGGYCLDKADSFTLGGFAPFAVSQHMFNIYDGPGDEESNAFLDIKQRDVGASPPSLYANVNGVPKSANPNNAIIPLDHCYIQNAAIGWKQPNGFYYPPTFHSLKLFFNNVDIRHYVIVPLFNPNTYNTNPTAVAAQYCTQTSDMFNNFTGIDRQTVLTDDDGSLTGWAKTISVSVDRFFVTPRDGIECQTDGSVPVVPTVPPVKVSGTARTSPYDYVSTVVYPECAGTGCRGGLQWDADCTSPKCFGVPLYRLYQTGSERPMPAVTTNIPQFIRMAGASIFQRQSMTVNHGLYYVDLTVDVNKQIAFGNLTNVFLGGQTYDFFNLFAKADTQQTYQMFVGQGLNPVDVVKSVKPIRVNIKTAPLVVTADTQRTALNPPPAYDMSTGILTVTIDLKAFQPDFMAALADHCVPRTFCQWTSSKCVGKMPADVIPPLTPDEQLTKVDLDNTCAYAGKDIDCPTGGCVGFSVALPESFEPKNQTAANNFALLKPLAMCYPNNAIWNRTPTVLTTGACTAATAPLNCDFCDKSQPCKPPSSSSSSSLD